MIEKTIIQYIKNTLPEIRVYHDFAPQNAAPPLVIIQRVGGSGNLYLGETSVRHIRVQISVWATERVAAIQISQQIEQTLFRLPEISSAGAAISAHDIDTNLSGMHQDFFALETTE